MSWNCSATTTAVPTRRFRVCVWLWKSHGPTAIAFTAKVSLWSRMWTLGCRSKSEYCTAYFCVLCFSSSDKLCLVTLSLPSLSLSLLLYRVKASCTCTKKKVKLKSLCDTRLYFSGVYPWREKTGWCMLSYYTVVSMLLFEEKEDHADCWGILHSQIWTANIDCVMNKSD